MRPITPAERYMTDPYFRRLVDLLYDLLRECQMTATEIREAAILATQKYEFDHPSHFFKASSLSQADLMQHFEPKKAPKDGKP